MYTLVIYTRNCLQFATVKKDGEVIECLDGVYVDSQDINDLSLLLLLANNSISIQADNDGLED